MFAQSSFGISTQVKEDHRPGHLCRRTGGARSGLAVGGSGWWEWKKREGNASTCLVMLAFLYSSFVHEKHSPYHVDTAMLCSFMFTEAKLDGAKSLLFYMYSFSLHSTSCNISDPSYISSNLKSYYYIIYIYTYYIYS